MGCEVRVSIRDDLRGESEPGVDMLVVEFGDLGASNGVLTGEEDCASGAPVVDYG